MTDKKKVYEDLKIKPGDLIGEYFVNDEEEDFFVTDRMTHWYEAMRAVQGKFNAKRAEMDEFHIFRDYVFSPGNELFDPIIGTYFIGIKRGGDANDH